MTLKTTATPENATHLLGAAAALKLDKQVVQMKFGELVAPDEVFKEAGFTTDGDTGYAFFQPKAERSTGTKKVAAKTVEQPAKAPAKKTTAKRKPAAKKTTAKKTAAPAEKE